MEEKDKQKIERHLKEKWALGTCPMCRAQSWEFFERVYTPMGYQEGGYQFGGTQIPVIPVVCTNCGFTAWLNAIVAGVIKKGGGKDE